ncbi:MAG: outer membrane lipoprotein carrier protein LolA [Thermodesulfobacteriota bacterium]|nr:outer membrane lipoprotein carrier protein LolA [Thermodesulfobacteriota bacterium]
MATVKQFFLFSFFAVLFFPFGVMAADDGLSDELVRRISSAAQHVETLSSDFTQEKYLSMFEEKLVSTGQFYYQRPDRLRWELLEPIGSGFVLNGDGGRRWHQRIPDSEPFKLDQDRAMALIAEQLFAWAKADLGWLQQNYQMTAVQQQPIQLRLIPRAADAGFLSYLLITFSASDRYVSAVEIHESDGDYTRINFSNTQVNSEIAERLFTERSRI